MSPDQAIKMIGLLQTISIQLVIIAGLLGAIAGMALARRS